MAQAASVLKAEAASGAISSPKGEAPRRGENGAARARNGSGRGGGGGGGGSAMRFEVGHDARRVGGCARRGGAGVGGGLLLLLHACRGGGQRLGGL